jgi:hypothetical protein
MRRSVAVAALVGLCRCGPPYHDVVGPFTGVTYRFVVDEVQMPETRSDFADDLNGDNRAENQLGNIAGALAGQRDLTTAVYDLLGSGVLASVVEITTDDPALRNDPTVGVRFIGHDGAPADVMGGALSDGVLVSNLTRATQHPASAIMHLPLYKYADPVVVPAIGLEVQLTADGNGFDCTIHGAFPSPSYLEPAWLGMAQMLSANPPEFPDLFAIMDPDGDGIVTFDEFASAGLIRNVLAPDVKLTDRHGGWAPTRDPLPGEKDSLSFGIWMHLTPCAVGSCHAPPVKPCQDRALDGDETDIDCGGACLSCPSGARCNANTDCQTKQCVGGICAQPNCSDGVADGGETGVDCGSHCGPCPVGQGCRKDGDCKVGYCNVGLFSLSGVCAVPRCTDRQRDDDETGVDCGGNHCQPCPSGQSCLVNSDCASKNCAVDTSSSWCIGCVGTCS